jgi:hypothetical protein
LQLSGIFTAVQDFEIIGYQSSFQMEFNPLAPIAVPPIFPSGILTYNVTAPRFTFPTSPVGASNQQQNTNILCILQPMTLASPPNTAWTGAGGPLWGGSAEVALSLPSGLTISIRTGTSLALYLSLAGLSASDFARMTNTLFVYM